MDPRIAKTRSRLQEALFELARERGIDSVTVSDIAHRAGVNRSTFYLHYSDTETLLADALDQVTERAGAKLDGIDLRSAEPPAALIEFLTHADAHAGLYRRVFTEPGYGVVVARLRARLMEAVEERAKAPDAVRADGVPSSFIAAGLAGSILGMLGAWLGEQPHANPAHAARWIWDVVRPPSG